jgi:transcriptional regulator with XRE-family HTH domain
MDNKGFDADGFYRALAATVTARGANWKQVSEDTGVSTSTLSRMATGRQPDAASLTALAAWSGLDPTEFTSVARRTAEPIALVVKLLRQDPKLDKDAADSLEAILKTAYLKLKKN